MLVQAVVFGVVSMAANQSVAVSNFDSVRIDAKYLSNLLYGQHSSFAETIISRHKMITPQNASHDARGERLAFAGLPALAVQNSGNLWIGVVVQQLINGSNDLRAGLPLFPGSLW